MIYESLLQDNNLLCFGVIFEHSDTFDGGFFYVQPLLNTTLKFFKKGVNK